MVVDLTFSALDTDSIVGGFTVRANVRSVALSLDITGHYLLLIRFASVYVLFSVLISLISISSWKI